MILPSNVSYVQKEGQGTQPLLSEGAAEGSSDPDSSSENESPSPSSEEWGVGEGVRGLLRADDADERRGALRGGGRGESRASEREGEP